MQVINPVNLSTSYSGNVPAYLQHLNSNIDLESIYLSRKEKLLIEDSGPVLPAEEINARKSGKILKIPHDYVSVISPGTTKLYCAFLYFKTFNSEGAILPKDIRRIKKDEQFNYQWLKKLAKAGWAKQITGDGYRLNSYPQVWAKMGCDRYHITKKKKDVTGKDEIKFKVWRYSYHKIDVDDLPLENRKACIQAISKQLHEFIIKRNSDQLRYAANHKRRHNGSRARSRFNPPQTFAVPVSCKRIANKWFGYSPKSVRIGHQIRKTYLKDRIQPVPGWQVDPKTMKNIPRRNCFFLHF